LIGETGMGMAGAAGAFGKTEAGAGAAGIAGFSGTMPGTAGAPGFGKLATGAMGGFGKPGAAGLGGTMPGAAGAAGLGKLTAGAADGGVGTAVVGVGVGKVFGTAGGGVKACEETPSGRVTFNAVRPAAGEPGGTMRMALPDWGATGFGGREIRMVSFFNLAGPAGVLPGRLILTVWFGTGTPPGTAGRCAVPGAGGGTGNLAPVGKFGLGGGGGVKAIIGYK
jgi:hypothetical protein